MDLLASIRKTGSRGGVNFSWDEVANSTHRENYLGHSLKAPVGRWQKGRDLNWYAKAEPSAADSAETDEERRAREHKEEIRKIKEAEEDAIARALGMPPPQRNTTGANSVDVGSQRNVEPATKPPAEGVEGEPRRDPSRRHGESDRRDRTRHRSNSRHRHRRHRRRSREAARPSDGSRDGRVRERAERRQGRERSRSRSVEARSSRHRNKSRDRSRRRRSRSREHRRRSTSPRPRRRDG